MDQRLCGWCGTAANADASYCTHCGAVLDTIVGSTPSTTSHRGRTALIVGLCLLALPIMAGFVYFQIHVQQRVTRTLNAHLQRFAQEQADQADQDQPVPDEDDSAAAPDGSVEPEETDGTNEDDTSAGTFADVYGLATALTALAPLHSDVAVGVAAYSLDLGVSGATPNFAEEIETPQQASSAGSTTMTSGPLILGFAQTDDAASIARRIGTQQALVCTADPNLVVLFGRGAVRVTRHEIVEASIAGPTVCLEP